MAFSLLNRSRVPLLAFAFGNAVECTNERSSAAAKCAKAGVFVGVRAEPDIVDPFTEPEGAPMIPGGKRALVVNGEGDVRFKSSVAANRIGDNSAKPTEATG